MDLFIIFLMFIVIPILAIYVGINFLLDNIVGILFTILLIIVFLIGLAKKPE